MKRRPAVMMLHLNNLKLKNYSLSFLSAAMMVQYDTTVRQTAFKRY